MTYLFEKEDLSSVLEFQNISNYSHQGEKASECFCKDLDNKFLNNIIKLQPELIKEKNIFLTKLKSLDNFKNSSDFCMLFLDLFQNKIKITSLKKCLFKRTYANYSSPDEMRKRKKLFLKLNKKSDIFFDLIYEKIKTSNSHEDPCIYDCYLKILRIDKNNISFLNNKKILESIEKISTFPNLSLSKKKIYTYVSIFYKNQFLYDFVMKDMGDLFKGYASLNNYWESKLSQFSSETIFKKEEDVLKLKEDQSFFYTFEINEQWIVKEQKISEKKARIFCMNFNRVLTSFIEASFDVNFVNKNINDLSISLTTAKENESNLIKKLVNDAISNMNDLLVKFNHDLNISEQTEEIEKYIFNLDKHIMSKKLDKNLEIKSSKNKSLKI